MQKLMIKAQDKAKEIRHLQDTVLPQLKQQLADTKGIFKGKELSLIHISSELVDLLIDKIYVYPDKRVDVEFKIRDSLAAYK